MARPALDLPDPMNDSGSGAIHSADDLLAQLAGEEIDRLLSEAEDAPEPAATRPQNVDRPAPTPVPGAVRAPADPVAPPSKVATPPPAAPTPIDDAVLDATEEALDDLFRDFDEDERPTASPTTSSGAPEGPPAAGMVNAKPLAPARREEPVAAPVLAPVAPVAPPPSAADDLAAELEADEAAHAAAVRRMKQPAAAETPAPTDLDPGPTEVDESGVVYERIPLVVRVLEWVNAPLGFLSVDAREAVGKIALVTTVNAIAILTYVLLFRRH